MIDQTRIFIRKCFTDLGFSATWINWMMQCVTTPSRRVIFNSKTGQSFQPEDGIGPGDPLHIFHYLYRISGQIYSLHVHSKKSGNDIKLTKDCHNILIWCLQMNVLIFVGQLRQLLESQIYLRLLFKVSDQVWLTYIIQNSIL